MNYIYTILQYRSGGTDFFRYNPQEFELLFGKDRTRVIGYEYYTEGMWESSNCNFIDSEERIISEDELTRLIIAEELNK